MIFAMQTDTVQLINDRNQSLLEIFDRRHFPLTHKIRAILSDSRRIGRTTAIRDHHGDTDKMDSYAGLGSEKQRRYPVL